MPIFLHSLVFDEGATNWSTSKDADSTPNGKCAKSRTDLVIWRDMSDDWRHDANKDTGAKS